MNDEEFDRFASEAGDELGRKQDALTKSFRVGKWDDFAYDALSGRLEFKEKSGVVKVESDTLPLGSFSTKSGTWQWAWANKSTPPDARAASAKLKELAELTGMEVFRADTIEVDDGMAWELVAMCVKFLGAKGCYSMTADSKGTLRVFVAITEVRKTGK